MASGSIEMQRILLARACCRSREPAGRRHEHRPQPGGPRRSARWPGRRSRRAGGDPLVHRCRTRARPAGEHLRAGAGGARRVAARPARRSPTTWRRPRRCAARPGTGASPTRWPSGWRGPPTSTSTASSWSTGPGPRPPWPSLDLRWAAVDARRRSAVLRRAGARPPARRARPRSSASLERRTPVDDAGRRRTWRSALVLPCWTLLGMLDRAIDLTREYVLVARAVRPAAVRLPGRAVPAHRGRGGAQRPGRCSPSTRCGASRRACRRRLDDALALRLAAIEAAEIVFRVAHQLHGAMGFCDETTAVLAVALQPAAAAAAARPVRDPRRRWRGSSGGAG